VKRLSHCSSGEEDFKNNRIEVTEDNVADVVSMMSGIPVNRIAQTEAINWLNYELIEGKVIGQRSSDENCVLFKEIVPD
jgi:ATP-dependent Clp protease ATP-binding subunit ClpC